MKVRKYRIASLLAIYTPSEQERMLLELSAELEISPQMFRLYMNAPSELTRLNLTSDKLQIIADYLKVNVSELLNTPSVLIHQ